MEVVLPSSARVRPVLTRDNVCDFFGVALKSREELFRNQRGKAACAGRCADRENCNGFLSTCAAMVGKDL